MAAKLGVGFTSMSVREHANQADDSLETGVASFDFVGDAAASQLALKVDDLVTILDRASEEWWWV